MSVQPPEYVFRFSVGRYDSDGYYLRSGVPAVPVAVIAQVESAARAAALAALEKPEYPWALRASLLSVTQREIDAEEVQES